MAGLALLGLGALLTKAKVCKITNCESPLTKKVQTK